MQKRPIRKAKKNVRATAQRRAQEPAQPGVEGVQPAAARGKGNSSPLNNLKQNLSGKRKAIFEILDDVKKVPPEQWQDPNNVEQMAKNFANKLGLPVPEQRIKQFVNAYKDATKNGPNANVDDLVKKYGPNVDDQTLKEIKKFVPKSK
ncbi:hypothetical protein LLE49_13040 [Alicyclobacillus tolerans]|uniref:hypothetical protein n=1 Tax=Alicyclobacillus tolerans TaxID=90970 RepID=UPI001F1E9DFE|nr:hypothetical protein [Alicyclobacillus tolerans]MCF8565643.1 hypothetical protein [Alicyclobacillus tolerans]